MTQLSPSIALDQFNTGFAQQSQHNSDQQRQQFAREQAETQRQQFGQQREDRQAEQQQRASQFNQRQALDMQQFAQSLKEFELNKARHQAVMDDLKQKRVQQLANTKLGEMTANELEAQYGITPSGIAGPPADQMLPGEPSQDDRPTAAPQAGADGFVGGAPTGKSTSKRAKEAAAYAAQKIRRIRSS